jgi:diguanylate cyclase (GGDEF)-like protein
METQVLIVDHSLFYREMITKSVEPLGYRTKVAASGQEAIEFLENNDIHIVITGFELSDMTGIELCWKIRAGDPHHQTYCILMTTDGEVDRRIAALDAGADDLLIRPPDMRTLAARLRAAERTSKASREVYRLMTIDYLTGALNRRHFEERFEALLVRAAQKHQPLALLTFDIDHFKAVNDSHSHAAGDETLRRFVAACQEDRQPGELFGRLGGEEFALVLPGAGVQAAIAAAEAVRRKTEALVISYAGIGIRITVSIGLCFRPPESIDAAAMLHAADTALYFAKISGRNRVVVAGAPGLAIAARFHVM